VSKEVTPLDLTRAGRDVSVTERSSFRTCRRRWGLETIDNWVPKSPAFALEFGTGIHTALESYYASKGDLTSALDAFTEWHDEFDAKIADELGGLYTEDTSRDVWDLRLMGLAMLELYPKYESMTKVTWTDVRAIEGNGMEQFDNKRPKGYPKEADVIVHESGRCMVPLVHPTSKQVLVNTSGEPIYLTARIDMLVDRATPYKGLWVVDHKTSASAPNDRGLDFDEQPTGYCYVVWRLTGKMPRGVIFNYLIKNTPKEPRWVQGNSKNGPHNSEGKALSTAKDQLTTPDMYREALKDLGLYKKGKVSSEAHAECLEGLLAKGWDPFFQRYEPRRNQDELLAYEAQAFTQYSDMEEAVLVEEMRYPNKSTWWCPSCSVKEICQAMDDGGDPEGIIEQSFMQGEDRKAA